MTAGQHGGRVLLGDIGGTNARFAILEKGEIGHAKTLSVTAHDTAIDAIAAYLSGLPQGQGPSGAALACAGPIEGGSVAMTNSPWRLETTEIERHFGFARVLLANDFAAQAWAVPRLGSATRHAIGGGVAKAEQPVMVLGPGTGLGVASYLPPPQGPAVLVGEGGHATMPATNDREAAVLAALRARFGHASAERVLSGEGLVQLHETLAGLEHRTVAQRSAAEIAEAAGARTCKHCQVTLDLFCAMLGGFAGNLALTLGAKGGVYIAGGIAPRILDYLTASKFRERFEAKGRFKSYLAAIPTWVVTHPTPAFLGLVELLSQEDGVRRR